MHLVKLQYINFTNSLIVTVYILAMYIYMASSVCHGCSGLKHNENHSTEKKIYIDFII